jgi:hypothetical protein
MAENCDPENIEWADEIYETVLAGAEHGIKGAIDELKIRQKMLGQPMPKFDKVTKSLDEALAQVTFEYREI